MRIDLHRHLEGSHSPKALIAVAQQFRIKDPLFAHLEAALARELTMPGPTDDARVFYACIQKMRAAYVSEAAIGELARLAFVEAAAETDGFEMRVSLFSMTRTVLDNEGKAWRDVPPTQFADRARKLLLVVLAARDAAMRSEKKPMLVRVGFSRTFESAPHYRALADVLPDHRAQLSGLDVLGIVTGADKEPMPDALRAILEDLRSDIPDLTIHAGEFEGAASVAKTLALSPQGIGHGVHAVDSDDVMAHLAKDGVTVEVCPTSNRMLIPTALAALEQRHGMTPLKRLQRAHVHCVVGSDDPTPMSSTYTGELALCASLGVDMEKLARDTERRWLQLTAPR